MKGWIRLVAFAGAIILLVFTFINASWLAGTSPGGVRLIAHRGVSQLFDHTDLKRDDCTATRIEPPVHDYLENTVRSMQAARQMGADVVEIDIAPTKDGQIAVFHDWTVDCRTNGKGNIRDKTIAEVKLLDPGYGYTADSGKTFPFRGRQVGTIPTLQEALNALPSSPIIFNFKGTDAGEADQLAVALKAARRDVVARKDIFYGAPGPVDRIRQIYPDAFAWSKEGAKACTMDYLKLGWTSIVPQSCRNGILIVPLNRQWAFWGWPNRTIQRMDKVGARILIVGPYGDKRGMGLTLPEQLGKIPSTFKGYVWVDDIWTVGPALRPNHDIRTQAEQDAAEAGLKRRREATK
ncbi:glycerophosphodiester phosphodiesterase family protein [Sphingomonas daechungensis]|uniref:glycerophosphodiester phosphodiesterase family protein n=1 Tax=Sphingomonas daechungensis TaxID=1176646 RepID=UPI003784028B